MIDLLFIAFLLIFMVYHYTITYSECNTAASTILQIWTGSCGMACRNSGYSRFSGMSGLNQPARLPIESDAPNSSCVCESCPCAFIENVLRRCQPASDAYEEQLEIISVYMANIMRVMSEAYFSLTSAIECQTTCQRQAQLVELKETYESNQNFTFDQEKSELKKHEPKKSVLPKISEFATKLSRSDAAMKKDVKIQQDRAGTSKEAEVQAAKAVKSATTAVSTTSMVSSQSKTTAFSEPTSPAVAPTPAVPKTAAVSTLPAVATSLVLPTSSTAPTPALEPFPSAAPTAISPTSSTVDGTRAGTSCSKCMAEGKTCMKNCPTYNKRA